MALAARFPWRPEFLEGSSFVVGGASSGLGRAVAEHLVAAGARVLVVGRTSSALRATVSDLGDRTSACVADLATRDGAETVVAEASARFGSLAGVLVNAGGGPPGASPLQVDDAQWRSTFDLLLGGPIHLVRSLLPILDPGASVLFVTATSVRQPVPGLAVSNVLRPGVAALVKMLAQELAPCVRVNSLAPGRFDTEYVRKLEQTWADETGVPADEQRRTASARIPMGRYGDPHEFGQAATFLLSPASSYITGTSVLIDGGLVPALP
ncbi:oxidoreductase [Actinomycetospora sp. NBRC 106375]|uniref:SDR family oxidoreductase n=1 Tax=Actinomycetospora sp. NBRC 106375 TaxID=3032207 RepID=UPI0024A4AC23|nr:SDR family oxidoreductase [Actinomycetospora sp. NBRC 106375]GLZ49946.1 oxidoreductase [Actinomycetospora sp. NBRC 106375]